VAAAALTSVTYLVLAIHTSGSGIYAAAAALGAAYGTVWSVLPTVISELFGTEAFGTHWGYMILAPGM
jgi:molybdenum-dependent DNA-binding transcriptional regulator ModE